MREWDVTSQRAVYSGYIKDLLDELMRALGLRYELYLAPDGQYGHLQPGRVWSGMINELLKTVRVMINELLKTLRVMINELLKTVPVRIVGHQTTGLASDSPGHWACQSFIVQYFVRRRFGHALLYVTLICGSERRST